MSESTEGPGAALCAARESLGITCREVAEALNLPLRVVEAIEANAYEKLPVPVFTRGYIRAYAKLLELDADPIVARYSPQDGDDASEEASFTSLEDVIRKHPGGFVGGGATLVVVLLGAVLYALWPLNARFQSSAVEPAEQSTTAPAAGLSGSVRIQAGDDETRPTQDERSEDDTGRSGERLQPRLQIATLSGPAAAEDQQAASELLGIQPPGAVRRITTIGNDHLWFAFTDECWVEVFSTTGENLYSDLSRAGQTLELVGSGPFRILLGYAPGVRMAFNGEPVVLAHHTRNNVANLVLGQ
ncbi:MAG: DUF4115 domain-containing protein [Gammaproteobacteria bacterium]|nr:DUF4115 domain-containing protein [Gammaproteobacteria bacterium]